MSNIMTVQYESELQIIAIKKMLEAIYESPIRPRGRHSDRKKVLGGKWRKWAQNDIPWRKAETVSFYIINKTK
jgi:hypothetical protein